MAVDFNNTGGYFYSVGTDLDNLTTLTVAVWVYAESFGSSGSRNVVTHWDWSADKSWTLFYSTTSSQYAWEVAFDDTNNTDFQLAPNTDATGVWQHLLGRWGASEGELSCWLDGSEGGPTPMARASISDCAAELAISGQWAFGARYNGNYFDGRISHVCGWNAFLTDEQCVALAGGVHPLNMRRDAILFWMPLYDTSFINDMSGAGYTAAVGWSGQATADGPPVGVARYDLGWQGWLTAPVGEARIPRHPAHYNELFIY